ncbi:TVP38/TMEM64 family protein [Jeotgalibacillus sp. S-D1]|uniref:TVP38/TMEM64 family protein n=1 Tax=Jeotgalibacillus sp. S-D1 TaxID=2552189 RepID=UPI00105AAB9E|nr:TVP38/TMEM64 family protein [Jeotgalibacillus sp. S-D1]TDL30480.1 TVP38/TMEM64 family protein [Jeotgalibacillus sp. S-D1]
MNNKVKKYIPLILFFTILLALFWFSSRYINVRPNDIQEWISSFGVWGPLLFIAVYALRPLILFPASILSLAGGLAFGAFGGFIYILIGASLSAIIAFLVSRLFQEAFIKKTQQGNEGRLFRIKNLIEEKGFLYVLVLRVIPIINFDVISYSAGLSSIRLRAYIIGTIIGIIPGTFAYSFLGSSFVEGNVRVIVISLIVFGLISIIPLIYRKKVAAWLGIERKENKHNG